MVAWRIVINNNNTMTMSQRIVKTIKAVKEASDAEIRRKKINWENEFADQFEEVYTAELDLQDQSRNNEKA
jgi:hypothetical protein